MTIRPVVTGEAAVADNDEDLFTGCELDDVGSTFDQFNRIGLTGTDAPALTFEFTSLNFFGFGIRFFGLAPPSLFATADRVL